MNDLAGNDDEAIGYYERCLKYPPVNKGVLNNLGVLYEDNEKFDKAADCYARLLKADPNDDRARLFLKDAQASMTQYYNPDEEQTNNAFRQVMEVPVTDFELSVRSRNCLKKMGIRTLGDLTRITEASLLASKNFGETSLEEIRAIMNAKGLRIGQSLEQGASIRATLPSAGDIVARRAGGPQPPGDRIEPIGPGPQVHEPAEYHHDWRADLAQRRRVDGSEELRRHLLERGQGEAHRDGPEAPRGMIRGSQRV